MSQSLTVMPLWCKAAVADWCGAVQLNPSSSAAEEVVNQLGHWGNFAAMCLFFEAIKGCLKDGGLDGLQARVHIWLSAGGSISQVSIVDSSNLLNLAH